MGITGNAPRLSAVDLPLRLDRDIDVPLAVQLAGALRAAATGGVFRVGDRLPSTREMADRLGVSRTVTAAAYEQLRAEGWLAGRHGSGTYLAAAPRPPAGAPEQPGVRALTAPGIDLMLGSAWVQGLDLSAWRRAWRAAAQRPPLGRPHRAGLPDYRAVVVEHLLRHRGLRPPVEAVLATGGTTAGLIEVATAALRPGDTVAVEEPGYQRAVAALLAAGMRVVPAPVDGHGLVVPALPPGVRAVYCTPAHQFPLGVQLPADRRVALVEHARAEGILLIEDEYDGELRYDVAPLPVLASFGRDVVVQLGTMSKILTASLGAGWLVGPPRVTAAVLALRERTGTAPAEVGQRVVVELARAGDLARHLRRLRRDLAARRCLLVGELARAGLAVRGDDAGAHVLVPLPSLAAENAVRAAAAAAGLRLDALARHYAGTPDRHGIPISYTACSAAEFAAAIPPLVAALGNPMTGVDSTDVPAAPIHDSHFPTRGRELSNSDQRICPNG